jgi:hypothetical protein
MAQEIDDIDRAAGLAGGVVFTDKAVLLRPDPTADEGRVMVTLALPKDLQAAAPWSGGGPLEEKPGAAGDGRPRGGAARYTLDVDSLDGGGYLAIGRLHPLPAVAVRGGAMVPVVLDGPRRATDEDLGRWIGRAAGAVADFYQGLPRPGVLVLLAPVRGSKDGGVFGTVLRRSAIPSAVLRFGDGADAAAFDADWVAPHELFHLGNPVVAGRIPWFIEGFTTYYHDVLMGRADPARAPAMWADLADGFRRHCDGATPLARESRDMVQLHHYTRVYWGGACLAFQIDVAVRRRTGNRESLDSLMRALHDASREHPLTEAEIIDRLDRAAGDRLASRRLASTAKAQVDVLYKQLGVVPPRSGGTVATLRDDAPLAHVRRAIFGSSP